MQQFGGVVTVFGRRPDGIASDWEVVCARVPLPGAVVWQAAGLHFAAGVLDEWFDVWVGGSDLQRVVYLAPTDPNAASGAGTEAYRDALGAGLDGVPRRLADRCERYRPRAEAHRPSWRSCVERDAS